MLGDRWGGETVPVETSQFSVEYWRQKASEFQRAINSVDSIAQDSWALASVLPEGPQLDAIMGGLDELESKRTAMRIAAEGINAGAAVINAAGGRFPVLSVPATLGLPPLVLPAAAVAAFTAAAALVSWAVAWSSAQAQRIGAARAAAMEIADPDKRDETLAEIARLEARSRAAADAGDSPLASIASIAKWAGLAVLGFMAWRAFQGSRG